METKGTGKFFVPKYDQDVDGYGIWQGEVYEAFPTTVPEPIYAVNDEVIKWGIKVEAVKFPDLGEIKTYRIITDGKKDTVVPLNVEGV